MPEAEQLAEVKRRADAFVAGLDEQDGWEGSKAFKIVDAYNITLLDTSRPLEYSGGKDHLRRPGRHPASGAPARTADADRVDRQKSFERASS